MAVQRRRGTAAALVATAGMLISGSGVTAQDGGRTRAKPESGGSESAVQPGAQPPQPVTPPGQAGPAEGSPTNPPPVRLGPQSPGARGSNGATSRLPAAATPAPLNQPPPAADEISIPAVAEAIELRALVDWVAETLNINVAASDQLTGSVVINAPVTVRRDQLITLLNNLLEQQGYAIYKDDLSGWYRVQQGGEMVPSESTTRIIPTPGMRPSSLAQLVNEQLRGGGGQPGQPGGNRATYIDDLGVIMVTDTPRRVQLMEELVRRVLARAAEQEFIRFDLQYVAAGLARTRVLELLGTAGTGGPTINVQGAPPAAPGGGGAVATVGLAERLNVDPQGNALLLRGHPDEAARVEKALAVIDRPNLLEYRQYFAGQAAAQIAELAQRRGWGAVETIDSTPLSLTQGTPGAAPRPAQTPVNPQQIPGLSMSQQSTGGPVMIVDTGRGVIIYYGTPAQHAQLEGLIKTLDTEREQVVIVGYKLKHLDSDDATGILAAILGGQISGGSSGSAFLPNQTGNTGRGRGTPGLGGLGGLTGGTNQLGGTGFSGRNFGGGRQGGVGMSASGVSPFGNTEVVVISDRSNNQVLVRAPGKQQTDWGRLIAKIDQRRPQVYIEVQIVAVSTNDDFRLRFEVQGINAGGSGGAVNTNFGLGSLSTGSGTAATDDFLVRKNVASNLSGITAAIIQSDQVPIVLNALKRETDTRILSSPQLLVDDNEMAEIVSLEEQPTTTTSQGTSTNITSFQGFENAGTSLSVTPSISEGGYMRLSYSIELSNFLGVSSAAGIPPTRQRRSLNSESVTIPGDTTIVVGGIKVDSKTNTIAKVPLLGDIPIVGYLFRDTNIAKANTRLYVFITPRILRDPNFRDLALLTKGPQAEAGLSPDVPELKPAFIEMIEAPARLRLDGARPGGL